MRGQVEARIDERMKEAERALKNDQVEWSSEIANNLKTFSVQMDMKILKIFESLRVSIEEVKLTTTRTPELQATRNCQPPPIKLRPPPPTDTQIDFQTDILK